MNILMKAAAVAIVSALPGSMCVTGAQAMPLPADPGLAAPITLVAGGCGPGAWRGPWGHCRRTPYVGPLPGGWYQVRAGNGCPPGYWRGPWAIAATRRITADCRTAVTGSRLPLPSTVRGAGALVGGEGLEPPTLSV